MTYGKHERELRRYIRDQVKDIIVEDFVRAGFEMSGLGAGDGWKAKMSYPYGNLIKKNESKGGYDIITIQFVNDNYTEVTILFGNCGPMQQDIFGGILNPWEAYAIDLDVYFQLVQNVAKFRWRLSPLCGGYFSCKKFLFNETMADADFMIESIHRCCYQVHDGLREGIVGPNVRVMDLRDVNANMRSIIRQRLDGKK